jgi:penicillin-binding protein 2
MRLTMILVVCLSSMLGFAGCRGAPAKPAPDSDGAGSSARSMKDALDQVLASSALPVAVAVVDARGEPLAFGSRVGADPSTLKARPGSTVKPLLAWVAAEAGMLEADARLNCDGTYPGGFVCHGVHGDIDLSTALEASCNTFFFDLTERIGIERVTKGFAGFGLQPPELSSENGDRALLIGAGHGPMAATPLELAVAYARLSKRLADPDARVDAALRARISEGLLLVVTGAHGTGRGAAVNGLEVAGKTGTAEGGDPRAAVDAALPENSWFVGFTPARAPELVVAVLVVGGAKTRAAAPLAGRIFARIAPR